MFKKFKDKLAEEMKQSPARLQASVQQLAQAVVSPALSNSSIQEVSASSDNFSLTEDGDETPKNTPVKHSFQTIDLMSPSPNRLEISRRSSVSSVTSDASSLFPMYESPPNLYHLQSDMDQSASEVDDNISPHLDRVTKDQLYSAYRKVQAKYHKYRGRYTDLATHYRELDKVKSKLESVLVETQDKVLRRITDLKEQCQLEQQAKAHLEEALRNDIEEKDHIISTLNTKVKLLQASGPTLENAVSEDARGPNEGSEVNLIDLGRLMSGEPRSDESNALSTENAQLKEKLKKLEALVLRYKESLKRNKEKFTEVTKEKSTLENEHEALKSSTAERIGALEGELSAARVEIENLTGQVDTLQRREEESAISLAENKLSVHRELEEKEEQIKQLRTDLKRTTEDREKLNEAIAGYKAELGKLKSTYAESNAIADKAVQDASRETSAATQQAGMKHREEIDHGKEAGSGRDENTIDELTLRLKEREAEFQETQRKVDGLEKQCTEYRNEKESFRAELSAYKTTCTELRNEYDAQKIVMEESRKKADATIEQLQATVQSVDKELENMRDALIDRDHVCENYSKKVQQYAAMLEKAKHKLTEQETQMKSLENELEDKTKLSKTHEEESKIKRTELNTLQTELQLCRSTVDDLRNKVQADSSTISLLKKERSDLTNRLVHYNDCIRRLRQDCVDVRSTVKEEFSSLKTNMSDLCATLAASLVKLEQENVTLKSEVEELHSKLKDSELTSTNEIGKLRSELAQVVKLKSTLEAELKDELNATNTKLIAESDNFIFKIHDLEKAHEEKLRELYSEVDSLDCRNRMLVRENGVLQCKYNDAFEDVSELEQKLDRAKEKIKINGIVDDESDDSMEGTTEMQLREAHSEIARLRSDLTEKEDKIKSQDEKLASEKEQHAQDLEEHQEIVQKYRNLEAEYQAMNESHAKDTANFMKISKTLQETVNVKLVQLKKLKIIKERQSKTIEETNAELSNLKSKHTELSNTLETCEKQVESLKLENAQLAKVTLENKDLKDKHNDLLSRNERLRENEEASKRKIEDYERDIEELRKMAQDHADSYKSQQEEIERLNDELTTSNKELGERERELSALKDLLTEKEAAIKLLEDENSNTLALSEEKITDLQLRVDSLARTNDALRKELETARNVEDTKSQFEGDKLREENKRLEAQLDEALITFQAKETQMQLLNNELKAQANQLREQLKINEEEQGMRLKQLVKEFQAQLHDKEEELQAALEKRFDRQHNYESNLVQQYKEQLKDCQIELSEKSEQLEHLVLEKKDAVAEKGKDIDRLVEKIAQIKQEHVDEMKELEKKWKVIVQQRIDNLHTKHEEELNELTKEWQNERKELESTSRVAMAAIHTSTGSIHTLQQTLTSQRRELAELRKLVKLRQDTLEDSTEIEYLRNILFEYMMGRETMVLARVIAAVVKFDQDQTTKILKKEEDKLTLFGSLGLA
ncbi:golgin subfamily A member 4 isoform X2 [Ooceraea biroi]|uniref:golgin subfamily A member 4 isoform X2 n=1 Tax=Ooceraea biroi TaxID=2015173 RepID=UPI0005B82078|nr:golgin subfamily A member 4 isoform X2 [Ooceraea biroi]